MSTRARIGIENEDGSVTSIYTNWDGYPEHHAPILLGAYSEPERIRALIALGDLSMLTEDLGEAHDFDNPTEGYCIAYGRDRGEHDVASVTHAMDEWPDYGQEHEYLFRDGRWLERGTQSEWILLDQVAAPAGP